MDWTNFKRVKEVFPSRTENHAKIGTSLDGAKTARTEIAYIHVCQKYGEHVGL